MRRGASVLILVGSMAACGPAVLEPGDGESASSGAAESSATTEASDPGSSGSEGDGGEVSGASMSVCGDGQLAGDEACDDGNADDGDGCSAACEPRGTIAWTHPLPGGFAVGLTAREGRAVGAVQQFGSLQAPSVALGGYDRQGVSQGEFIDVGGLSDLDFARGPVALLPDGNVAVGYPAVGEDTRRHFGVANLEAGMVWGYRAEERWGAYYGTSWNPAGLFVLHGVRLEGEDVETLVVDQFDEAGNRVATLPLGVAATEFRPLLRGALPARPLSLASVITLSSTLELELWTHMLSSGGWAREPIAAVGPESAVAAFSDGVLTQIWTGSELITIDELEHVSRTERYTFEGELLWADLYGFVVSYEGRLVLFDAAGDEQVSVELPVDAEEGEVLQPRFVRPDADAGLFVLVDAGIPVDFAPRSVAMHYVVR